MISTLHSLFPEILTIAFTDAIIVTMLWVKKETMS